LNGEYPIVLEKCDVCGNWINQYFIEECPYCKMCFCPKCWKEGHECQDELEAYEEELLEELEAEVEERRR